MRSTNLLRPADDGPLIAPPAGRVAEIMATPLHEGAAAGFSVAALCHVLQGRSMAHALWLRQAGAISEAGDVCAEGAAALGLSPSCLTFVTLRRAIELLQAAVDAARCAALGCVVVEFVGNTPCLDLVATRRLGLAAETSGCTVLLLRYGGRPLPSSAWTRWRVAGAPSRPEAPFALGPPRFDISLLRHRGGKPPGRWIVEWTHDRNCLAIVTDNPPVSGALVPTPDRRSLAA